jgi:hypothetical protein
MRGMVCTLSAAALLAAEGGNWNPEKISKYDGAAEPVASGVPFPGGVLRDAALLAGGRR